MIDYYPLLAGILAAFASFVELIHRYSVGTKISFFFRTNMVWFYLILNAIAGFVAYLIMNTSDGVILQASFGIAGKNGLGMAAVAGLGSMAIMRSAFISLKLGEAKYSVGPGVLLDILLSHLDKKIDQERATSSAIEVHDVMRNIDFSKANLPLPTVCLHMLEQVSRDDQEEMRREVEKFNTTPGMTQEAQNICLGISIKKVAGLEVLKTAVDILGKEIQQAEITSGGNAPRGESGQTKTPAVSTTKNMELDNALNLLNRM